MRADRIGDRAVGADRQPDPVRDRQAGVPAGLLDDPHHVARGAFGRQFRCYRQVQRDQPGVAGQRRGGLGVGGGQLQLVLAGFELDAGRHHALAHPDAESLAPFTELIADEVNVKAVVLAADPASLGTFELAVNPRRLGPRLGGQVQQVIRAVKAGEWTQAAERVVAAGVELKPGEYELKLAAADPESTSALPGNTGLIGLDLAVSPALAAEGTARDVVRVVQQARRDAGLAVSDRIRLTIGADGAVADAVRAHMGFVAAETLAVDLEVWPSAELATGPRPLGDATIKLALSRVSLPGPMRPNGPEVTAWAAVRAE